MWIQTEQNLFHLTIGYIHHHLEDTATAGRYIFEWGAEGTGQGQFNLPWGIDIDSSDHIYIADCYRPTPK